MTRALATLRAMGMGLWVLLIAAPTPGAVGSCSSKDDLDQPASLREYCREREELLCVRGQMRLEYTVAAQDACRRDATDRCATRFWYDSCQPTVRETEACLNALRLIDTLDTTVDEIDECNTEALSCADTSATEPADYTADAGVMP